MLSPEKTALIENYKQAAIGARANSVAQTEHIDLEFHDRLMLVESKLDRDLGADILFPRLMNVMSQDNLLDTKKNESLL